MQSDGQSAGHLNPLIDQHVAAGADFLEVQSLSGSGTYSLSTSLTPASDPAQTLVLPPTSREPVIAPIAVGDFTNNGITDIVTPAGVHLGTGDGTFQAPSADRPLVDPRPGSDPRSPSATSTMITTSTWPSPSAATDSVSISLGNGDGTFQPATTIGLSVAGTPDAIVAGDFGNGQTDLAVAVADTGGATDDVVVLMGNGDGTFTQSSPIPVGLGPVSIAAGDFGQNGHFLAVADISSGDVTILTNQGGGSFSATQTIELPGSTPTSIVAGDFGTGNLDLAVTDASTNAVDILQGNGDGTFQPQPVATLAVGANPFSIVAGDFGNGHLDLAVADANANDVSVLLGNGNGTFQPAIHSPTTSSGVITQTACQQGRRRSISSRAISTATAASTWPRETSAPPTSPCSSAKATARSRHRPRAWSAAYAAALATGDFTGNGNLGVAVVNQDSDSVTILPGNGDGTFQQSLTVALPPGSGATSIVAADFNNDGRTDLAVTDSSLDEVSILLGNGDGTFQSSTIAVRPPGGSPYAIVAGDFTGNGRVDLAVVDQQHEARSPSSWATATGHSPSGRRSRS